VYYSLLTALVSLFIVAGCQRGGEKANDSSEKPQTLTVRTVRPEYRILRRKVEQPGAIQPYEVTPLYAKVSGYARKVHVDIGQVVKGPQQAEGQKEQAGTLLLDIDMPELVEELNQKKALARQAVLEIEQAKKNLETAKAAVAAAESLVVEANAGEKRAQATYERWDSEAKRLTALAKERILDIQSRDETINQLQAADAARDEARAHIISAEAMARKSRAERDKAVVDIDTAKARSAVARAAVRRFEALVGYSRIRAPFDGIVTERNVDTWHFVQPPSGGQMKPLFAIARLDKVRVVVTVPESDASLVREGNKVHLHVKALKGGELTGTVSRTSWALDTASRTLRTEIDLPNPGGRLQPNMYVTAVIDTDWPKALSLPSTALIRQGDTVVCYLVEKGKAVRTVVQAGHSDGSFTEMLKKQKAGSSTEWENFSGKETVIAAPPKELADGQAVETRNEER